MAKLVWDQVAERFYETGVDHGVLYPQAADGTYPQGVAWSGLTAVTESPSGADSNPVYADNIKYLDIRSAETFGATIEALYYPDEFATCDGTAEPTTGVKIGQQTRVPFGLAYRTILGNDVQNNDYGYKLHLIYNATAAPSERAYSTVNESPEQVSFSWEATTTPVNVTGFKPTSNIIIDSTKVSANNLTVLEGVLFGTDETEARLPLPDEVISILTTGEVEEEEEEQEQEQEP